MNSLQDEGSRSLEQDDEFRKLISDVVDLIERSRQQTADTLNRELVNLGLDDASAPDICGRDFDETMNDPRIRVLLGIGMDDLHLGEPLREAVVKRIRDGLLGRGDHLYCYMASDVLKEGYGPQRLVNLAMYHRGWRRVVLFDFADDSSEASQLDRVDAALEYFGEEARDRDENLPILIVLDLHLSGQDVGFRVHCRQEDCLASRGLLRDIAWATKQIGLQRRLSRDYGWD